MLPMDDTPIDSLISELESADPSDAPDIADAIATELSQTLDAIAEEAPPAPQT